MKTPTQLKHSICGLLLLGTLGVWAEEPTATFTIEAAFEQMQQHNPALQRARFQVQQKEFERAAKQGLYMPKVSMGAKAVAMSDALHLDLTPVRDAILPLYDALGNYGVFTGVPNPDPATNQVVPVLPDAMSTAAVRQKLTDGKQKVADAEWNKLIQEERFATVTADFIWPIYTGGKIQAANKAAAVEVQMGSEQLRQVQGELLSELVTRYYATVLAMQAQAVRQQMFQSMDKHYQNAQKMFDAGMIAKVELLQATVARSEAERELKKAHRDVEVIRAGLAATLSSDSLAACQPISPLFVNSKIPELGYFQEKALHANPQLKQIESQKQLVQIKDRAEKADYLPTVAAIGTYNLVDKNLSPYMPHWLVGVGVNWTLFDGLARNKTTKATHALENQVQSAQDQAVLSLQAYVNKLHQQLHMNLEQVQELNQTLELTIEYASSTEKAFNEGMATSTSVTDAHLKVAQVKLMRLKVFYEYDVVLATLLQTSGIPDDFLMYCKSENSIVEPMN